MLLFLLIFAAMTSLLFFFPLFFSLWGARRNAINVMVNDPFSDLSLFLVVKEETIWSEITNPFLDSSKNTQPQRTFSCFSSFPFPKLWFSLTDLTLAVYDFWLVGFDPFGLFLCFKVHCLCPSCFGLYNLLLYFEDFYWSCCSRTALWCSLAS